MDINEFMQNLPEEWHGNVAISEGQMTVTVPGGKGSATYNLGDYSTPGVKTLRNFERSAFESAAKISLKV
jgi:hypothetical protein